ncbi:hypothetical protein L6452_05110 [Arctium lappa]|uniref:Uncharacterized protein n=1 Tax=Arctium lappa TaxID=4217 RepID=A0ACB9EF25_ARCLA|nr:hypothetical protein L6452_05110 [Arctium lappa]
MEIEESPLNSIPIPETLEHVIGENNVSSNRCFSERPEIITNGVDVGLASKENSNVENKGANSMRIQYVIRRRISCWLKIQTLFVAIIKMLEDDIVKFSIARFLLRLRIRPGGSKNHRGRRKVGI